MGNDPSAWVVAYTAEDGWHRADSAQRNLEALIGRIDEEPESEPALQRVRQAYEELLQKMAVGFGQALQAAGWTVPKTLPQTRIYPELVEKAGSRVAYFLVDALRFEMGVELRNLLAGSDDLVLRPAIAALPTITPVGMAALLPGPRPSFDVVEAEWCARFADRGRSTLKDVTARMKFLKFQVPGAVDIELGKLLQMNPKKLKNAIGDARLVVVRSQEIDKFGEMDGDFVARQVMDTVLQNVARAVRKLAGAGIDSVVITADHGYQFTREKDEAFRTDNPRRPDDRLAPALLGRPRRVPIRPGRSASPGRSWATTPTSTSSSPRGSGSSGRGQSRLPSRGDEPAGNGHPGPHPADGGPTEGGGFGRRMEPEGRAQGPEQPHVRRDDRIHGLFAREPVAVRPVLHGRRGAGRRGRDGHRRSIRPGFQDRDHRARVAGQRGDGAPARGLRVDPGRRPRPGHRCRARPVRGYPGSPRGLMMNETLQRPPARDTLDDKVNRVFAGKVVRKDLVRRVKVGANVPVFVLEYLLGKYCASSDELAIQMGLQVVNDILAKNYIRPDESTKAQSRVKEEGEYTFIDKVKVRLVDSDYWAEAIHFGDKYLHIPTQYVRDYDRLLMGGVWAQVDMRFEYDESTRGRTRSGSTGSRRSRSRPSTSRSTGRCAANSPPRSGSTC